MLKYGQQIVGVPVFATDDSRLLPETATGFLLTSNELEGLELNAGHFTALNAQAQTGHDSVGLKRLDFVGGTYAVDDNFSLSLYYSDAHDAFQKVYGNLNYTVPLVNEQSLNFDFNIYRTDYEAEYTGTGDDEGNTIWSLAATYSLGAHSFMLAYQKSIGGFDGIGYDYGIDGGGTVYLANSVQRSDFNAQDEKSWQARYDLDLAAVGLNGFKFMTRYIYGDDPDRVCDLMNTVPGEVGEDTFAAIYDPANYVFCSFDPWEGWQKTKEWTVHFHIKDWAAGEKHARVAGEGQGRIPEVIREAVARGYRGFATLEPHLLGGGPTGGVTGPELFPKAVQAFQKVLEQAGATYQ